MAKRKLEVVISGDSRQLESAFRRSGKSADSFGRKLTRGAGKGMMFLGTGAAVAAVAGVAATGVALVKAGKAAAEAEASNARLAAQLRSMGKDNAAVRGQIEQTVQSLSKLGAFDDEDLQDAFTTLVRSSGNVAKSQKDLALVANVARGAQLDLSTAAKLVNRVNSGNVGALKRYGIALEEGATKEQAIAALRKKFAGQAEAYANTAAGAQEAFAIATENALEQVGVALTPLIVEFSKFAQDVLPKVAAAVSVYLGQAIAWLKTNWPQIRAVIVTVFDALETYYRTIVIPVAKGIITAFGAAIGFIRQNFPAIKAAAQDAFGWIETNIIPTVRTVAKGVTAVVQALSYVWREHGDTIKAVLQPAYNMVTTIIKSALIIVRSIVEATLAVIRGDFSAAGKAYVNIMRAAFDAIIAVIGLVPRMAAAAAEKIGAAIMDGIKSGIGSLYGSLKSYLEQQIRSIVTGLNPFSPVAHGGEVYIGKPLMEGAARGVRKNKVRVAKELTDAVKSAVLSARSNLGSLTGGLAGMLGTLFGASSAEGKRLREIRAQQKREEAARERVRLQAAIDAAETDEERAQATQDLNDWLLEQEAQGLEDAIANRQQQYENDIANLTAAFNKGELSAQAFRDALNALIGGQTGSELGAAFALEFGNQITAVFDQIKALASAAGVLGVAGPSVEKPGGVSAQQIRDWEKRRDARLAELEKAARGKDTPGKDKITPAERTEINKAMDRWFKNNPKPKALAMGGVLRSAVLAGEAGPEAVLPLSSGRAQRMLAGALEGADRLNGRGGGTTIVNVTVNGNEFSARDFARKLKPELDRVVGFGTV